MAAYAALVSLTNTIEQILNHPRLSISFNTNQIKSLVPKITFLEEFLDTYSHGISSEKAQFLENQIASAAHAVEDAIESHVAHQILAGSLSPFLLDEEVIEEIDAIKEKVMKITDQGDLQAHSMPASSSRSLTTEKSSMVGFDDYLVLLMDKLTGQQSNLQVISIVGMGGIGKTTLARNTFENPLISQFFDIRAWVTVSQNYNVRNLLLELISCISDNRESFVAMEEHRLGEHLHKQLWCRRYLIILDDIWDSKAFQDIMLFCPDNSNGSRFVVTTRLSLNLSRSYLTIDFLDEEKSWTLFCERVFGQHDCPVELQKAGKRIVENCKGLPLSIVVIAGFLRNSDRSQEFWESVARNTNLVLNSEEEEQCLDILYLSYIHLPACLKPCFLYMGVFREDEEIRVSQLTKLWVAEGFLKPNEHQSLEEVGESYLTDLVDRNLILVSSWGSNGKIKACNLHDLVRELCLKVGEKEKFICVMKLLDTSRAINERRIVIHESVPEHEVFVTRSAPVIRSLTCRGQWRRRFSFILLRVLNVVDEGFVESDSTCVNLRCIDRRFVWYVDDKVTSTGWHLPFFYAPRKISIFWNLQIISIKGCQKEELDLYEIWDMPQLRHVKVDIFKICDPPQTNLVLQNLQTLSTVENFRLSEEVCKRIPNVKKLSVVYTDNRQSLFYCLHNLDRLHKLQSLNLCFNELRHWRDMLLNITFPNSLRKLSLYGCRLHWEDLSMVGSLPRLEVLKLEIDSVTGREWNPVEGEFCCLKFLKISCTGLAEWNADSCHFPVIESIFLESLIGLEEIPWGIGEIPTLKSIRLKDSTLSCALSAMEILVEQESYNEELRVEVQFGLQDKMVRFKEKVEEEARLRSNNLHLKNLVS